MKDFTSPKLLLIDQLGYLPVDKHGVDLLFQVTSKRYECGSATTNLAIIDWGEILNNHNILSYFVIDRLVHRGVLIQIKGDTYRVRYGNLRTTYTFPRARNLGV